MRSHVVDAGPLIRGLCDQLELVSIINAALEWDDVRSRLSPGERILVLILGMFMRQRPLYRVHESFRRTDIELLVGKGVSIEDLNDDGFGRALDKLHQAGAAKVFSAVCARAAILEDVRHDFLHWDSTSRYFYGDYSTSDEQPLISHGHSKDHRPDLKQIMLTLLANREGMALWGSVENGNASDKKLNAKVIDQIVDSFSPERLASMTYVADSAFVTVSNLRRANTAGLHFLSRLPENFAACAQAKRAAFDQDGFVDIGKVARRREASSYRASEQRAVIDDVDYRLVVYHSSSLEKRKEKSLERDLAAERESLRGEAADIFRSPFVCREDAEKSGRRWVQSHDDAFHRLDFTVVETKVMDKRGRGRPKKGAEPTFHVDYQTVGIIGDRNEDAVMRERQRRSAFVLITTLDENTAPARTLLEEYKQQGSIERRFAFMKDREIVDSFFLKKPERVQALGYVLLMVVVLFSILERRVRRAGQPLPTLSRGDLPNPTGLEILRNLSVSVIEMDDETRLLDVHVGFERVFAAVLDMARVDRSVYTTVPLRSTA